MNSNTFKISFRAKYSFPLFGLLFFLAKALYAESATPEKTTLSIINEKLFSILFMDIGFGYFQAKLPLVVMLLAFGGVFFTFYYNWINVRAFKHALLVITGRYDKEEDAGDVSHFKALTAALSATIGLGNIAGVAIAIQLGGPGAIVWMLAMGFFGMSSKFSCCTMAMLYRKINSDGSVSGGPMYYFDIGFAKMGGLWKYFGKFLAIIYAFMIIGSSFGGGNMFQANQTLEAVRTTFNLDQSANLILGLILAFFVAIVIIGGVKRIGTATEKIVPLMAGIYISSCLFIILSNWQNLPTAIVAIYNGAFKQTAVLGGLVGVFIIGVQRAAFSNEAGLGTASIIHAAAKTSEPVREGIVAILEPFIDTIIVCSLTAMVVVVTGTYSNPEIVSAGGNIGVGITAAAFNSFVPWFHYVLTLCIILFAYSTMISWSYYGERGWIYLMDLAGLPGLKTLVIYRLIYVCCIVIGSLNNLTDVVNFTDAMVLGLALPNIIGGVILAHTVKPHLANYMQRLKRGEFI